MQAEWTDNQSCFPSLINPSKSRSNANEYLPPPHTPWSMVRIYVLQNSWHYVHLGLYRTPSLQTPSLCLWSLLFGLTKSSTWKHWQNYTDQNKPQKLTILVFFRNNLTSTKPNFGFFFNLKEFAFVSEESVQYICDDTSSHHFALEPEKS